MSATLRGTLVEIRPLTLADSHALSEILRDRRSTRFLPPRVRHEAGLQFVRRVLKEQRSGTGFSFAIVVKGENHVVGQVRLMDWSRAESRAEVGVWLKRKYWGKGFGTEAVRLACLFGFRSMRLHRVVAKVVSDNGGSAAMLRKLGFRQEGTLRREARVGRTWTDVWVYGLLRGELRGLRTV
jgi:RimJ/RimL family protein N-acetyltransferase